VDGLTKHKDNLVNQITEPVYKTQCFISQLPRVLSTHVYTHKCKLMLQIDKHPKSLSYLFIVVTFNVSHDIFPVFITHDH